MRRFYLASTLALALSVGCQETTTPTIEPPDGGSPGAIFVEAASPTQTVGQPDAEVASPPSVRVYNNVLRKSVAGIAVTFHLKSPDGTTKSLSVTTGSDGIATVRVWKLGKGYGTYMAVASVPGGNPVEFTVFVHGAIVALYDLIGFADAPFSGLEGHYVLYEDGTYNHVYNMAVNTTVAFTTVDGTYQRDGSGEIKFYLFPAKGNIFTWPNNDLWAVGSPYGSNLRVTYADPIDYNIEIYALR